MLELVCSRKGRDIRWGRECCTPEILETKEAGLNEESHAMVSACVCGIGGEESHALRINNK